MPEIVTFYLEGRVVYQGLMRAAERRCNMSARRIREAAATGTGLPRKSQFRRYTFPGNVVELIPIRPDLTHYVVQVHET